MSIAATHPKSLCVNHTDTLVRTTVRQHLPRIAVKKARQSLTAAPQCAREAPSLNVQRRHRLAREHARLARLRTPLHHAALLVGDRDVPHGLVGSSGRRRRRNVPRGDVRAPRLASLDRRCIRGRIELERRSWGTAEATIGTVGQLGGNSMARGRERNPPSSPER